MYVGQDYYWDIQLKTPHIQLVVPIFDNYEKTVFDNV